MTDLRTIAKTASELGKEAKESIEDLGRSASRRLDEARDGTGGALHAAASGVRTTGQAIDKFTTSTAKRLDATASFVEDYELGDLVIGLRKLCRRHVTGAIVTAGALGFLVGIALTRATHPRG